MGAECSTLPNLVPRASCRLPDIKKVKSPGNEVATLP